MIHDVLVVEGDPFLRFAAMDLVEDAGFSGRAVGNAVEALTVLAVNTDIRIMFTSIGMPGSINGLELVQIVHRRWPHISILVASGASSVVSNNLPPGTTFLAKPYLPEAVIACLKSAASPDCWHASQTDFPAPHMI
ncbi:response regulator [Sulfitobacter dubius]|uniref:response regulator n=1 Tax=Sulfitobacter dubius TaxID=218673 RepID=UPI002942B5BB|nr:response regulator [Sulfitobacter dubius]WOI30785.1 response regulator [Sulfitobacter dubius]